MEIGKGKSFVFRTLIGFVFAVFVFIDFASSAFATTPNGVGTIDQCLQHKLWTYNEIFSIWVDDESLVRCEKVNGVLKAQKGTYQGGGEVEFQGRSSVQACAGKGEHEILSHGTIQRNIGGNTYNGRVWEEKCSALETLPGRNALLEEPIPSPTSPIMGPGFSFGVGSNTGVGSTYGGGGLAVPDRTIYDIRGVSTEKDLKSLIIGWTNFLLPYVSVISVFAVVVAGLFYILSFTSEDLNAKAKSILIYVILGVILIFSAYTIVTTLLRVTGL